MNYSEPTGASATIALIRKPATVTDPKQYLGPILFNPGGPGGSGVDQVLQRGDQFATVIGPQFDLVGFDPRGTCFSGSSPRTTKIKTGVRSSKPGVAWFESEIEASLWSSSGAQNTAETSEDFARMWARGQIIGQLAEERALEGISHINTENVARDMLRITEAYGYEKLQYWGFSYELIQISSILVAHPLKDTALFWELREYWFILLKEVAIYLCFSFASLFPVCLFCRTKCVSLRKVSGQSGEDGYRWFDQFHFNSPPKVTDACACRGG